MNLAQIERDISRQQFSFVCFFFFFLSFRENKWIQSSAAVKQVYSEMIGIQIVRPRFRKYLQNKIAWNESIYVNQALKKTLTINVLVKWYIYPAGNEQSSPFSTRHKVQWLFVSCFHPICPRCAQSSDSLMNLLAAPVWLRSLILLQADGAAT